MKKIKLLVSTVILSTSLLFSNVVFADNKPNVTRLAGQDRYQTSNAIISQGWQSSNYAILVNSQNYPDALSSSPLAKKYNCPILLTDSNTLTSSTEQKLKDLGVKNVFIIGGQGVVSSNIESYLESNMGISVKRIYGQDRFETSVNVAKEIGSTKGCFVVSGEEYEDALSISPVSAQLQYPIILVASDQVPDVVKNYINNQVRSTNKDAIVDVVGGSDVIDNKIVDTLKPSKVYNQSTKYERNLALINDFKSNLKLDKVFIASDKGFADALSGSALAAINGNPIILLGDSNQSNVSGFISTNSVNGINILGGTGVISDTDVSSVTGSTGSTNNSTGTTVNNGSQVGSNDEYVTISNQNINIKDYKQYITPYVDKINNLSNLIKADKISTYGFDGILFISLTKNTNDTLQSNSRIDLGFDKKGNKYISLINWDKFSNTKEITNAIGSYLPEKYKGLILNDLLINENIVNATLALEQSNIVKDVVSKTSKNYYNKKYETIYGEDITDISLYFGKLEISYQFQFK